MRFEELLQDSRSEGEIEGRTRGKAEAILELLQETGEISESLQSRIMLQTDLETLSRWLKLAARSGSIEEFESKM